MIRVFKKIAKGTYLIIYNFLLSKLESNNTYDSVIVKIRYYWLKPLFKKLGKKVNIQSHVRIEGWNNISIGDNSGIGRGSHLSAFAEIKIGNNVMIGEELLIITTNHGISASHSMIDMPMVPKPVKIGDNVWIGSRVTILSGVTIGNNVVIGAGAVVTTSFSSDCIIGGVPAKLIRPIIE